MLLRRRDEFRAPKLIEPDQDDIAGETGAGGAYLERRVNGSLILRGLVLECARKKDDDDVDALNIQMRDLKGLHNRILRAAQWWAAVTQ